MVDPRMVANSVYRLGRRGRPRLAKADGTAPPIDAQRRVLVFANLRKAPFTRAFVNGASRARTGDLLGAIQRRAHVVGVDGPTMTRDYW